MSFCAGQSGYETGWPSCDQEPDAIALTYPPGNAVIADCQVDCQPLERAMFSLDSGGRVQAADLVIWTAMDQPGQAGKS
jgi:hypothetical protein